MSNIHKSLTLLATVHGIDATSIIADCVTDVETTLLSFKSEATARRIQKKAYRVGDDLTSDDCSAVVNATQDDNRNDRRMILKRALVMSRRERAIAVCAGLKGY